MDNKLEFIAGELRRFYIMRRQLAMGQNWFLQANSKHDVAFRKAAEICDRLGAEPEIFVIAQFANSDPKTFLPQFLHSEHAEKNYKNYVAKMTLTHEEWYKLQLEYLRDQVELIHRPVVRALMDDHLNFKPWFRVCITKEPVEELIEKYGAAALEEYTSSKSLRDFLALKKLDITRFKS